MHKSPVLVAITTLLLFACKGKFSGELRQRASVSVVGNCPYGKSELKASVGAAIVPLTGNFNSIVTPVDGASFSILPTLPKGLIFATSDGKISGTPAVESARSEYTISYNHLAACKYTVSVAAGGSFLTVSHATDSLKNLPNLKDSPVDIEILNIGTQTASDFTYSFSGETLLSYSGGKFPGTTGNCGAELQGAGKCTLGLSVNAVTTGEFTEVITVTYIVDGATQVQNLTISGTIVGGQIDTTFGTTGYTAVENISTGTAGLGGADVDAQDRIVIGGYATAASGANGDDFAVVRLLSTGLIDPSFATAGKYLSNSSTAGEKIFDVKVHPSGNILTGAYHVGTNWKFINLAFSDVGALLRNSVVAPLQRAFAVDWHESGKYIMAGRTENGSPQQLLLKRLLSDGTLDSTFATAGSSSNAIGLSGMSRADAVHIQRNGVEGEDLIYTVGSYRATSQDDFLLTRFTYAGALDVTFNSTGYITMDHNSAGLHDVLSDVRTDSKGRVLAVGYITNSANEKDLTIIRLLPSGAMDMSFGSQGIFALSRPGDDLAYSLKIDSRGRVIVAGSSTTSGVTRCLAVRLTDAGTLDPYFGSSGIVETDFNSASNVICKEVLQQSDGKIVLIAQGVPSGSSVTNFMATRIVP